MSASWPEEIKRCMARELLDQDRVGQPTDSTRHKKKDQQVTWGEWFENRYGEDIYDYRARVTRKR